MGRNWKLAENWEFQFPRKLGILILCDDTLPRNSQFSANFNHPISKKVGKFKPTDY